MFPHRPNDVSDRVAFAPILLANLLPLAGVLALGWEPVTLVLIYGLEVLLSLLLASVKALFAARPPRADREDGVLSVSSGLLVERRGSLRPVEWLPPIPLRNVSFALTVLYTTPVYAFFFGTFLYVVFEPGPELLGLEVLVGVGALFAGQLAELSQQYVRRRQYERVSPYAAIETPARQVFVVIFALGTLGFALGSTGALVLVVLVKVLFEWATFRADGGDEPSRFLAWFAGPAESDDELEPVDIPSTEPTGRARPDRNAVVRNALYRAGKRTVGHLPMVAIAGVLVVLSLSSLLESSLVVPLGVLALVSLVVAAVTIHAVTYALAYATLEYQRRGAYLVAHDRLVEEPQWATRVDELRDVKLVGDRLADRLLGSRTIRVTTGWGETERDRHLGPFVDPDEVVSTLELPLEVTALEPMERKRAMGAVTLLTIAALSVVATAYVPNGVAFLTQVLAFGLLLVALWLWQEAFPDEE